MALKRLGQLVARAYVAQCLLATSARATWTVTSYYALTATTGELGFKHTYTLTLKPDADPTGKPFSTTTRSYAYGEGHDEDVEMVEIFYPVGAADASDIEPSVPFVSEASTLYLQEVHFTAPSSCPIQFTVTTQTAVSIPYVAASQVTPTSLATTTSTDEYGYVYTYVTAYLSEGAAPLHMAQSVDWIQTHDLADCVDPAATATASGGPDDLSESAACSVFTGGSKLKRWATFALPGIFVVGVMGL